MNHYSDKLIQRVTVVMPIADSLKAVEIIQDETYSNICVASTCQAKMRVLLDALNTNKAKSAFYNLLKVNESFLVEELTREGERVGRIQLIQGQTQLAQILHLITFLFIVYYFSAYYVYAACTKFFD